MRLIVSRLLAMTAFAFLFSLPLSAQYQNGVPTGLNGTVLNLACNQNCSDLKFSIPDIRKTDDYIVTSIPYTPFEYVTSAPLLEHPCASGANPQDDKYFDTTFLPFSFCFYGATYSKMVIGSNALLTFDLDNALQGCNWTLAGNPVPFAGTGNRNAGTCPSPTGVLYPRASIMFGYSDININFASPKKKMEARIEGVAPHRRMIISFNEIPMFNQTPCGNGLFTAQAVLHEGTGIVDVYIGNKPPCTSSGNGGFAILGIQNWNRDQGVAAPGKNCTQWGESSTGYRFLPSAGSSSLLTSQLYDMAGTLVGTATTSVSSPGVLDLNFGNICVPPGTTQYRIVTTHSSCDDPLNTSLITSDTITVNRTNTLNATVTTTATGCGAPTGTIAVTVPAGAGTAPYTYVLDGGTPVVDPNSTYTFTNVAAGFHVVMVTDASGGCMSRLFPTVPQTNNLSGTLTPTATSCPGVNNGSIAVTPVNGIGPFTYTLSPGGNVLTGATATFTGLAPGTYSVSITDGSGCTTQTPPTTTVNTGAGLQATTTQTGTTCPGATNGSITVTPTNGTGPFTFVLDGTITLTGAGAVTFNSVADGNHTITITDASGCTTTPALNVTVGSGTPLNATTSLTPTTCAGANNGSVTVSPTNGNGPYTFVLDGTITQTGLASTIFNGLSAGNHTITITDAAGCSTSPAITITIAAGAPLNVTTSLTPTSCSGASNGSLTVSPINGNGPYTFVLDGTVTQTGATSTTFNGLTSGSHTVVVTDVNGCNTTPPVTVTIPAGAVLTATTALTGTSCAGANNGTVTVTPANGTGTYTFVLDGTTTQTGATSTTFTGLPAGPHTVVITDASGCVSNPVNINIPAGAQLATTAVHTDVLCFGGLTGTITVTQPAGPGPYEYSLDGTTWQVSNVFNGLAANNYTVYFRETSSGCQGNLGQVVAQPAVLNTSTAVVPVVCNGQSDGKITITATGGVAPYEYSLDGTTWQASNVFNVPVGSYTIRIRDANLCPSTATANVTEPALLTATANTTNATCNGGTSGGNDGTITINAAGGNGVYTYSLDGGAFQTSNVFNTVPGNHNVVVKDNLGCTYPVNNITVGLTNDLTYTVPADPTICEGRSTQLQVTSNALQYTWTPTTGLSSATVSNPVFTPTVTTTYSVNVRLGVCTADTFITVNVNTAPVANAGQNGFICFGQTYQLQGSGGQTFQWSPTTYLDDPTIANPVSTPNRTTVYSLTVTDANGCQSLVPAQVTVDVTPPIKVTTYPFDTVVYDNDQFQLLATSEATDYLWTPSTGLSNDAIPNPVVTSGAVGDDITYKVTATTQAGCKGEGFVRVRVYKGPELYTPTGFTPNGDGKNDKFFPFPVGIKEIKYFRVFNRWGQLMFATSRVNDGWDGRSGGVEQASGVYVWMVEGVTKDNKVITKRGTVTLIR